MIEINSQLTSLLLTSQFTKKQSHLHPAAISLATFSANA